MITRIRIKNFVCHGDTEINFSEGLTVFIGRNGSGKSSVIDAMTYALYGKHTRGNKENIIRDSSNDGLVELEFDFKGKHYKIKRAFNARGELESVALLENDRALVVGERKRDEAVSARLEKLLGLNYERMRAAVVIQQGELDKILSMEPRELKELFDDLMGLTSMEKAYQSMYEVLKDFEKRIMSEFGRSLQDAERIEDEIVELEEKLKSCEGEETRIRENISGLERRLREVEKKLEELGWARKLEEKLRLGLERLIGILNERIQQLSSVVENSAKYLELLKAKGEIESRIRRLNELDEVLSQVEKKLSSLDGRRREITRTLREIEEQTTGMEVGPSRVRSIDELLIDVRSKTEKLRDDAIELGKMMASRKGQDSLLRLRLDQEIEEIVGIVYEAYNSALASHVMDLVEKKRKMEGELTNIEGEISSLQSELKRLREEREKVSKFMGEDVFGLRGMIVNAEKELERLGGRKGIERIAAILNELREKVGLLREAIDAGAIPEESFLEGLSALLGGDGDVLRELRETVKLLREMKYDPMELTELEGEQRELIEKISENRGLLMACEDKMRELRERLEDLRRVKGALLEAKKFYELLEKIRNEVYYRDGSVLRNLRSWILRRVADQARKYLDIFNVRIDDVRIEESAKSIGFKCYHRGREIDVRRLSGGEKVALALAIRLAIGDVLGAQRLGFFVLDEPTVHLDSDNKRKLLEVFIGLSKTVRQAIIITHDEELFEGVEAKIIKFERGPASDSPTIIYELS